MLKTVNKPINSVTTVNRPVILPKIVPNQDKKDNNNVLLVVVLTIYNVTVQINQPRVLPVTFVKNQVILPNTVTRLVVNLILKVLLVINVVYQIILPVIVKQMMLNVIIVVVTVINLPTVLLLQQTLQLKNPVTHVVQLNILLSSVLLLKRTLVC